MIRKFSSTSCLMVRRLAKRSNPGLGHQINAIEDAVKVIESDPEGFEDLESDLFNIHQSHKEHEIEVKRQREQTRLRIIQNKYFRKDPLPNLLTYAEKEHIKYLHSYDEDEWTVEKLAESFPANAEIIRKIVKANWSPMSAKRISSHDANVIQNWTRFKNGEYKAHMDTELYKHLMKFADRAANTIKVSYDSSKTFKKMQWQKPNSKEFVSIILSSQPTNSATKELRAIDDKSKIQDIGIDEGSETHLIERIKNKKPITIHQLKNEYFNETTQDTTTNDSNIDHLGEQKLENNREVQVVGDKNYTASNVTASNYTEKFKLNEIIISECDTKRYEMAPTKPRIRIPRKLWQKGAIYRTNNCYYDDDGEFLYKVPGMSWQ